MNLFIRMLGLPLDLDAAIAAVAAGEVREVDIATANGRPFLHQFAVGAQPRMVQERRAFGHSGRWSKIVATLRATARVIVRTRATRAVVSVDGAAESGRYAYVAFSNNLYGDDHMPYADRPDGGQLGVYRAGRLSRWEALVLAKDLMLGKWRASPHLHGVGATHAVLAVDPKRSFSKATIDGELVELEARTEFVLHARELKVLAGVQDVRCAT